MSGMLGRTRTTGEVRARTGGVKQAEDLFGWKRAVLIKALPCEDGCMNGCTV